MYCLDRINNGFKKDKFKSEPTDLTKLYFIAVTNWNSHIKYKGFLIVITYTDEDP